MHKYYYSHQELSQHDILQLTDIRDRKISGILLGFLPSFTLKPACLTPALLCRQDIILHTVAHHEDLLWRDAQLIDSQLEDSGIGLTDAHHGRLHHMLEEHIDMHLAEHHLHIPIEISDKGCWILGNDGYQTFPALTDRLQHIGIELLMQLGMDILEDLLICDFQHLMGDEVFQLETYLHIQRQLKGIVTADDMSVAEGTLRIDIRLAEFISLRLLENPIAEIGPPHHLAPVIAMGV